MKEEKWLLWFSFFIICLGASLIVRYIPFEDLFSLKNGTAVGEIRDRKVFIAMVFAVLIMFIDILQSFPAVN